MNGIVEDLSAFDIDGTRVLRDNEEAMNLKPITSPLFLSRLLRCGALGLLALVILVGAYACASERSLRREIATTPRDPRTGVVLGTESLSLDPAASADAPTTACLLIHGFVGSRKDFADLGQRLVAAGLHVELMRLPGHGTTPKDFGGQTPASLLKAVEDEYRALRKKYHAVYVVGFSMGGTLATLLAAREPVDRLVLAAPYYGVTYKWYYLLPPETWNTVIGPMIPYVIKSDVFIKVNRPLAKGSLYAYRCIPTHGVATLIELGRKANLPETMAAIHCPTLLVMAEGDEAACPHCAHAAYARLASSDKRQVWFTARSNHILFWDYDGEAAMKAIVDFLAPAPAPHEKE